MVKAIPIRKIVLSWTYQETKPTAIMG